MDSSLVKEHLPWMYSNFKKESWTLTQMVKNSQETKWGKQCTYESVSPSCPPSRENLKPGSDDLKNKCLLLSLKCHSGGRNVFVHSDDFDVPLTEIRTQSMDTSSRTSTSIPTEEEDARTLVLTDGVSWCDSVTVSPQEWFLVSQSLTDLHHRCCCVDPCHRHIVRISIPGGVSSSNWMPSVITSPHVLHTRVPRRHTTGWLSN